jgi:hypothetical protein
MTRGQNYAIRILVANDLGLKTGYVKEANNILKKKKIPSYLIGSFELESDKAVQKIYSLDLLEKAQKAAEKYLEV